MQRRTGEHTEFRVDIELPAANGPARILVAEDDPATQELLTGLLEDQGHTIIAVADGGMALAAIQAAPPDLVLSDVGMPGIDGFALCRHLKADPATRLIPVILLTAIGEEYKQVGIEAGADEFLSKPVVPGELHLRLRALLRMKRFTDDLESAETVLCTLAQSIEAKDPSTEGHCQRLAEWAVALGRALGLPPEERQALHRGGFLHDLGKVAVPERILLKPGSLTPGERAVLQRHPLVGEAICRPLRSLRSVLPIIRSHHERGDGSGYPDGLRGAAIPHTARILQVVDVYDALITDRPYRKALPPAAALEILTTETHQGWWDPAVVRALRETVVEKAGRAFDASGTRGVEGTTGQPNDGAGGTIERSSRSGDRAVQPDPRSVERSG